MILIAVVGKAHLTDNEVMTVEFLRRNSQAAGM